MIIINVGVGLWWCIKSDGFDTEWCIIWDELFNFDSVSFLCIGEVFIEIVFSDSSVIFCKFPEGVNIFV